MMDYLNTWKAALMHPKEELPAAKKDASVMAGVKHLVIPLVIIGVLFGLVLAFLGSVFSMLPGASALGAFGLAAIVVAPIALVIVGVIGSLVGIGVVHVLSKLLGGTGSYAQLYYLYAIWAAPLTLVSMLVNVIPLLGQLVALLLGIYGLYLFVLTLKEVHGFGTGKAVGVIVALIIVYLIVVAIATTLAVMAGLGAAQAAGAYPTPGLYG